MPLQGHAPRMPTRIGAESNASDLMSDPHAPDPLQNSLDADGLPAPLETVELACRARDGDREALNHLLVRLEARLARIVRIQMGPAARRWNDTADIVAQAWQVAARNVERLDVRSASEVLQWLARIAENQVRDAVAHARAQKRDAGREVQLDAPMDAHDSAAPARELAAAERGPSSVAEVADLRELLDGIVAELPEDWRKVVSLRDYVGLEWAEVARELDKPSVAAARQLHQRAWIRIRELALPHLDERAD